MSFFNLMYTAKQLTQDYDEFLLNNNKPEKLFHVDFDDIPVKVRCTVYNMLIVKTHLGKCNNAFLQKTCTQKGAYSPKATLLTITKSLLC